MSEYFKNKNPFREKYLIRFIHIFWKESKTFYRINFYLFVLIIFLVRLPINAESRIEVKTGISVSDYQPEFRNRYYQDDLLAGGSDALGFGAINGTYSQNTILLFKSNGL